MQRRIGPDEQALWERVAATVRPLPGRVQPAVPVCASVKPARSAQSAAPTPPPSSPRPARVGVTVATLDGSWDRRLAKGALVPERTIDLHDHTLAAAHARLEDGIEQAAAEGVRVLLVITGKGRGGRPSVIRAQLADWLDVSPQRRRVAALRPAHLRHGGGGAFYLVLKRSG